MSTNTVMYPGRRELAAGGLVLIVCACVVVTRGGTPQPGYADELRPMHAVDRPVPVDAAGPDVVDAETATETAIDAGAADHDATSE